ncbi:LysR family transcriptional regulator [Brachybacterium paraconglomeratum]|uniref:LysR family transcriptional regulator n=1 Tax=Brachybacterium paraconglomeratum TaxID=173362 RepID=UPI00223C140D|nr:LysR substrate-binding domain-containing protein [Brachybacterium paraconglomeratum]MCT1436664.1 LysR substrate-binding domain-containing protein [Brachybacterium paraconglomeratum]
MRLEHLRTFEAVVRLGTFTRAAQELYLAQPSLSRQIATLEADLGAVLLERGRRGAAPTEAGRTLLPIARRMLADAAAARRELDELAGLGRGRVHLGAPPTLCVSLVADVLAHFSSRHPGVELQVSEAGSLALLEQLQQGELDLAFVITRQDALEAEGAELIGLLAEELVVVASATRAEPLPERITLAQLATMPQVAFHRSYDLRAATDAAFAARSLTPVIAVEGAEMDAVLRFVERGIGVAVVPAMVVADRPGLRHARIVEPELDRTVNLARRRGVRPSAAARAMQELVFETVAGTELPGVLPLEGREHHAGRPGG